MVYDDTILPTGAQIVKFAFKGGLPFIWYIAHQQTTKTIRSLRIVGTGMDFEGAYIDTCSDGHYVWHMIEK